MNDLGLSLGIRTRGRAENSLPATLGRELVEGDLALLATEKGVKPNAVVRLRDSHHSVARCLSMGVRPAEISLITGYSSSRISVLQSDPAFRELVEFYRQNAKMAAADVQARLTNLNLDVIQELQERLDTDPEAISTGLLHDLMKTLADRTGHGPQTKSTNVNVNVDIASRMEAGRKRADSARRSILLDESGEPVT